MEAFKTMPPHSSTHLLLLPSLPTPSGLTEKKKRGGREGVRMGWGSRGVQSFVCDSWDGTEWPTWKWGKEFGAWVRVEREVRTEEEKVKILYKMAREMEFHEFHLLLGDRRWQGVVNIITQALCRKSVAHNGTFSPVWAARIHAHTSFQLTCAIHVSWLYRTHTWTVVKSTTCATARHKSGTRDKPFHLDNCHLIII